MNRFTSDEIEEFRSAFRQFDEDKSGTIDVSELSAAMAELGIDMTQKEVEELVKKGDDDGSGELNFAEFVEMISRFQDPGGNASDEDDDDDYTGAAMTEAEAARLLGATTELSKTARELSVDYIHTLRAEDLGEAMERLRAIREELVDSMSTDEEQAMEGAKSALKGMGFSLPQGGSHELKELCSAEASDNDDVADSKNATMSSAQVRGHSDSDEEGEEQAQLTSTDLRRFIDYLLDAMGTRLASIVEFVEVMPNMVDHGPQEATTSAERMAVDLTLLEQDLNEIEHFSFEAAKDHSLSQGSEAFKAKMRDFPLAVFPARDVCDRIDEVDSSLNRYQAMISGKEFITKPKCPNGRKCPIQDVLEHRLQFTHPCYSKELPCPHRHRPMHMLCYSHEPKEIPGETLNETRLRELEKQLYMLDVNGLEMGDYGVQCLAHVLNKDRQLNATTEPPNLKYRELKISNNHVSPLGAVPLLESCTLLTSVDLSNNGLGYKGALLVDSGVGHALEVLLKRCENLTYLNLSRNGLGDRDGGYICSGLKMNATLRTLDLRKNELGVDFGRKMAEAMSENRELKELYLGWNRLESTGSARILEELRTDNTREVLDLSWTGVNDEGAKHIAELIAGSTALRALNVGHNSIGKVGCSFIAKAIIPNKTLTYLDISFNPLGERAAVELVRDLRENTALETLDVRCVKAEDAVAQEIKLTLRAREANGVSNGKILFSTTVTGGGGSGGSSSRRQSLAR